MNENMNPNTGGGQPPQGYPQGQPTAPPNGYPQGQPPQGQPPQGHPVQPRPVRQNNGGLPDPNAPIQRPAMPTPQQPMNVPQGNTRMTGNMPQQVPPQGMPPQMMPGNGNMPPTNPDGSPMMPQQQPPKKKSKKGLIIAGVAALVLIGGGAAVMKSRGNVEEEPMEETYPVYSTYDGSGREALDNYISMLNVYNADIMKQAYPDSWVAKEWQYANDNELRQQWIKSLGVYTTASYPQVPVYDNEGNPYMEDGSTVTEDSMLSNTGDTFILTVVDFATLARTMEEDEQLIYDSYKASGYDPDDYEYADEITDLMLSYLLDKANFPTKQIEITISTDGTVPVVDGDGDDSNDYEVFYDWNGDGVIDEEDGAWDVNGDGVIDEQDATFDYGEDDGGSAELPPDADITPLSHGFGLFSDLKVHAEGEDEDDTPINADEIMDGVQTDVQGDIAPINVDPDNAVAIPIDGEDADGEQETDGVPVEGETTVASSTTGSTAPAVSTMPQSDVDKSGNWIVVLGEGDSPYLNDDGTVGTGHGYTVTDDSAIDQLLFSSDDFHMMLDTFGAMIASFEYENEDSVIQAAKAEYDDHYAQLEAVVNAKYDNAILQAKADFLGVAVELHEIPKVTFETEETTEAPTTTQAPTTQADTAEGEAPPPATEVTETIHRLTEDELNAKVAELDAEQVAALQEILDGIVREKVDMEEWVEPERQFHEEYESEDVITYTWVGAYYCQNIYKGASNTDAQVGDGSFEKPAGIGTTVVTKALGVDGEFHDIKITLVTWKLGQDAVNYAVQFSEKNRGFDSTSAVQLICYEMLVENLEKHPITISADMFLADAQANQSARTGEMYGFYNMVRLQPGASAIINDWATSTEMPQKYVCWGKSFKRAYPVVWFKLLAGSGEEVPKYNAHESFVNKEHTSGDGGESFIMGKGEYEYNPDLSATEPSTNEATTEGTTETTSDTTAETAETGTAADGNTPGEDASEPSGDVDGLTG